MKTFLLIISLLLVAFDFPDKITMTQLPVVTTISAIKTPSHQILLDYLAENRIEQCIGLPNTTCLTVSIINLDKVPYFSATRSYPRLRDLPKTSVTCPVNVWDECYLIEYYENKGE